MKQPLFHGDTRPHKATRPHRNPNADPVARTREQDWAALSQEERLTVNIVVNSEDVERTPRVTAFLRRWHGQD